VTKKNIEEKIIKRFQGRFVIEKLKALEEKKLENSQNCKTLRS